MRPAKLALAGGAAPGKADVASSYTARGVTIMAPLPTPIEYTQASDTSLRNIQERVLGFWFDTLKTAADFQDVSSRARAIVHAMRDVGYQVRLFDEDGESMVAYEVLVAPGHSLAAQVHWDQDAGASVCFAYADEGARVTLARAPGSGLAEH